MVKIKTSEKILNCAKKMFARYGYEGTIMDDLAKQCKVNKASIYYHHKDKATLYENTLMSLFGPIADSVIEAVAKETDAIKKLHTHIKTFSDSIMKRPEFAAILMREMASGGINMPMNARKQMQRILFLLNEILQLGKAQNVFKAADPLIIHFMIVGTLNLFVASIGFRKSIDDKTKPCEQIKSTSLEMTAEQISKTITDSLRIN